MSTQNLLNLKIHKVAQLPTENIDPTAIYLTPDKGHTHGNLSNDGKLGTANYVVITDNNKNITTSSNITTTELGYLNNVTSSIQTQLDGKAATSHASSSTTYGVATASNYGHAKASGTTPKANGTAAVGSESSSFARGDHVHPLQTSVSGSSGSCTGNAATATKLTTSAGDTGTPVYFSGGKPVACTSLDLDTTGRAASVGDSSIYAKPESSNEFNIYHTGETYINYKGGCTGITILNGSESTTAGGTVKAGTFNAISDKRLKENIVEYKLEKSILDLPVYKYNFIGDKYKKDHVGCLAQDLQEICPEIVNEDEKGYLSIEESKIVYLLLEEVKNLKKELDFLKSNS